ncbi:gluconokinase [Bacillaceae bacterium S4-13-58]
MKKFVIGLDIGTTSAKAVLFNGYGEVLSEGEEGYEMTHPKPSWSEQDPQIIERAAVQAIRKVTQGVNSREIIGVGMSAAMHSIICIDENHLPISPSITWADGRSTTQATSLKNSAQGTNIYLRTGTPIHPMSPLLKLIWMKETSYTPYKRAKRFISIKEFLLSRWFDEYVIDYSVAASTGMLNIKTKQWDKEALDLAGIEEDQLSKVVSATYQLTGLSSSLADEMGLHVDTPFVIGGSDGPLANLGIGAINPGEVAITVGTSGAIRQMTKSPKTDQQQEVFCYSFTDDLWVMGGPTNNGGIVLSWLKELFTTPEIENPFDLLNEWAEKAAPGSNGLLFLPYLNGERAPFWDAQAKGGFVGLTLSHKKEHLIRAGLEGVIYSLYHVGAALERLSDPPKKLLASGGFARSTLWLQILADIFGQTVEVPESHQSSAWGAAWLALYSLGETQSLDEIKNHIPMKLRMEPDEKRHNSYSELYNVYKSLYPALKEPFSTIHQIQNK